MNKGRGHQRVGTGPAFRAALLSCALIVLHAYAQAALGAADRHAGGADGIYLVCLLQLVRARLSRTEDRRLEVVVLRVAGPRPHFAGSPCGLPLPAPLPQSFPSLSAHTPVPRPLASHGPPDTDFQLHRAFRASYFRWPLPFLHLTWHPLHLNLGLTCPPRCPPIKCLCQRTVSNWCPLVAAIFPFAYASDRSKGF